MHQLGSKILVLGIERSQIPGRGETVYWNNNSCLSGNEINLESRPLDINHCAAHSSKLDSTLLRPIHEVFLHKP